jgi:hypothetical protein
MGATDACGFSRLESEEEEVVIYREILRNIQPFKK